MTPHQALGNGDICIKEERFRTPGIIRMDGLNKKKQNKKNCEQMQGKSTLPLAEVN